MCFNPHTHAGCDFGVIQARQEAVVSIHTPTQGVTIVIFNGINISIVSIHTPTQGVTDETGKWDYSLKVSIHTPTQGVT